MILFLILITIFEPSSHCFDFVEKTCNEYAAFTQQPYFVDKTKFLASLFREEIEANITNNAKMAAMFHQHVITTPPGFGKSLNILMIKAFAQVELDQQFRPIPKNKTKAYQIFKSLKIQRTPNALDVAMGAYYVLAIDLKFNPEDLSSESVALDVLRNKIKKLYLEYEFIKPRLKKNDSELTQDLFDKTLRGELDRNEIKDSLINLVYALRRDVFKREVVLLVDNFESLIWYLIKDPKLYYKSLDELVRDMLLELTYRRMRVKISVFLGVTNFNLYDPDAVKTRHFQFFSFLSNGRFQNYFGFTPSEYDALIDQYKCTDGEKTNVNKYYRPYYSAGKKFRIYNPTSIVGYLLSKKNGTGKFLPYWGRNQSIDFIAEFAKAPAFGEKLKTFIIRGDVRHSTYIRYHLPNIFLKFLESPDRDYENLHEDDIGDLFVFLHECGFVTAADEKPDSKIYKVPNSEVAQTLKEKILPKMK